MKTNGADTNVAFSDKVTATVERPRWYGTIYQQEDKARVKVFNIIPFPIQEGFMHYWVFYVIYLFLAAWIMMYRKKDERGHSINEEDIQITHDTASRLPLIYSGDGLQ